MLKEIFQVSNYPYLNQDDPFVDKLNRVLKTYGWLLLALILTSPILMLADKFVVHVLHHKSLIDINRHTFQDMYKRVGKPMAIFYICLLGPLCEELLFRFGLSFKKRQVAISVLIALFYISMALMRTKTNQTWIVIEIELVLMIILIVLCRYFISNTEFSLPPEAKKRWIILSITLFGLMHVFNFRPIELGLLWIYPVFVIPQIVMGWGITYIRFKNGFLWGVATHCLINTMATLFTLMIKK